MDLDARLVAQFLGWRGLGTMALKELEEFLLARAMEHDSPTLLFLAHALTPQRCARLDGLPAFDASSKMYSATAMPSTTSQNPHLGMKLVLYQPITHIHPLFFGAYYRDP